MTLRNGRYVVPVRADARSRVKGIVHDASGSGQTLFVEPLVVVELGNAWREAQAAVDEEEGRILDELSALVGANGTMLHETLEALAQFDFWAAKAHLAAELDGIRPATAERAEIVLLSARHPGLTGPRRADRHPARRRVHGARDHGPEHRRQDRRAAHARVAVPDAPGRPPRPGRDRVDAAGPPRRVRGHRRRAVDRAVAVDLLGTPAVDHPDRRARRPGDAGAARRARAPARTPRRAPRWPRRCSTTSSARARSSRRPRTTRRSRSTRTRPRPPATRPSSSTSSRCRPPTG